jgi:type II secretory pathway pseudopilin PulG
MPLNKNRQSGIVLLAVLLFVFISTLAASSLVNVYRIQMQRDREAQLLFVGDQFRRGISSYFNTIPPRGSRALPKTLDDLVDDQRFPSPVHHLRKIYLDPMTGQKDWVLVRDGTGIVGVHSQSDRETLKKIGFGQANKKFDGKTVYSEWIFSILP